MQQTLLVGFGAAAMLVLPLRAVLRLRRRGRADLAPWGRVLLAALAAAMTLGALLLLDEQADTRLSAHMLQHVLIGDVVPLLLVLAVRGPVLVHLVPARAMRAARRARLHRLAAFAGRPAVAFAVWASSLAVWHVPALYDAALENEQLHGFEHSTFLVSGLLVWSVLLDPGRRGSLTAWRRVGFAVALLAASGALGNALVLAYRPLYPAYAHGSGALGDQDLAGVVMMVEQLVTLGGFALLTARRRLAEAAAAPEPVRHPLAA